MMKKQSKDINNEVYDWVIKLIKSCITLKQINTCDNIVSNYAKQFGVNNQYYLLRSGIRNQTSKLYH